ncbi:MAG: hypothetical protein ACO2ON_03125 [Candidatus Nanopusillus sp.]
MDLKYSLDLFNVNTKKIKFAIIGLLLSILFINVFVLLTHVNKPPNIFDYLKIAWLTPLLASISALIRYFSIKDDDFKLEKNPKKMIIKLYFK